MPSSESKTTSTKKISTSILGCSTIYSKSLKTISELHKIKTKFLSSFKLLTLKYPILHTPVSLSYWTFSCRQNTTKHRMDLSYKNRNLPYLSILSIITNKNHPDSWNYWLHTIQKNVIQSLNWHKSWDSLNLSQETNFTIWDSSPTFISLSD